MSHTGIEIGWNSDLAITDDEVVKTSLRAFPHAEAEELATGLAAYAEQLDGQPLRVAHLRDVSVIEGQEGYHLRHSYDLVDGPSLIKGREDERRVAIGQALSQVAGMDTIDKRGSLVVPFDAKAANFHVDKDGPVLTDIFPVLTRHADGSFPLEVVDGKRGSIFPWMWGTKVGAMTAIMSTAIDRGDGPKAKLKHIATEVDEWCYDTIPVEVDPRTREQLRRQIGTHFIPYMLRSARHSISVKYGL
jgi:hypothetical protein